MDTADRREMELSKHWMVKITEDLDRDFSLIKKPGMELRFLKALQDFGLNSENCLIEICFPDSGSTYVGLVWRSDGTIQKYDLDLEFPEGNEITDATQDTVKEVRTFLRTKQAATVVAAYELFKSRFGIDILNS